MTATADTRTAAADPVASTPEGMPVVQPGAVRDQNRAVRSWPLLLLAVPAAAEVWSGWVGIAKMTGFGLVSPLPGIWSSLHLDTTVTLPVGVEAYAAYALHAWLAAGPHISQRTRRFAKLSALCSLGLGMAGQVAYHLLAQAGQTRAPWAITTVVSCLPVLVLAMGTTLAHMLREDRTMSSRTGPRADQPWTQAAEDRSGPDTDQYSGAPSPPAEGRLPGPGMPWKRDAAARSAATGPDAGDITRVRLIAGKLASSGRPVTRRALRDAGVRGSNERLNMLARTLNSETAPRAPAA